MSALASGDRGPAARRSSSRPPPVRADASIKCRAPSVDLDVSRAHHDERLGPGRSAAPDDDRLVLLPSGPDTVRGSPLRGTRSSTSHRRAAFENGDLGREFSPAVADCRYRAPLVPRLARLRKDTAVPWATGQHPTDDAPFIRKNGLVEPEIGVPSDGSPAPRRALRLLTVSIGSIARGRHCRHAGIACREQGQCTSRSCRAWRARRWRGCLSSSSVGTSRDVAAKPWALRAV